MSSLAAAVAVTTAVLSGHPAEDAVSDKHARKEVDEGGMAGSDRPSIARRHRSLERDSHTVLQHVPARSRHRAHRATLHEPVLELPH